MREPTQGAKSSRSSLAARTLRWPSGLAFFKILVTAQRILSRPVTIAAGNLHKGAHYSTPAASGPAPCPPQDGVVWCAGSTLETHNATERNMITRRRRSIGDRWRPAVAKRAASGSDIAPNRPLGCLTQVGNYVGVCKPGDESHSLIWAAVSSCLIFLRAASI